MDTFTTQKLLSMELEIIEREQEQLNESEGKKDYVEQPEGNAEEMNDIVEMMSEDLD